MIKKLLCWLIIVIFPFLPKAQNNPHQYDSLVKRALERYIGYPDDTYLSGVILIRVSKKDSLMTITSLYVSDTHFKLINEIRIARYINNKYGVFLKDHLA